jgi:hypothetical protein
VLEEAAVDLERRLWAKVDRRGDDECWPWLGAITGGYGVVSPALQRDGGFKSRRVHRIIYELLIGPIPDGLVPDHLCRNRRCANPKHLEIVTNKENILRGISWSAKNAMKTHCPQGHEYSEENTYIDPSGYRQCRKCKQRWLDTHYAANHRQRGG